MSEEGNGLGAGISQDPGTGLQIGELNPLARKLIPDSIYNKQSDDFFNSAKRVAVEQYGSDLLAKRGSFKGVVLRVEFGPPPPWLVSFFRTQQGGVMATMPELSQVKVRVPELHSALPIPAILGPNDAASQPIIDLYPTYYAVQPINIIPDPLPGELVYVDYDDRQNFDGPKYMGRVNENSLGGATIGPGTSAMQAFASMMGCSNLAANGARGAPLNANGMPSSWGDVSGYVPPQPGEIVRPPLIPPPLLDGWQTAVNVLGDGWRNEWGGRQGDNGLYPWTPSGVDLALAENNANEIETEYDAAPDWPYTPEWWATEQGQAAANAIEDEDDRAKALRGDYRKPPPPPYSSGGRQACADLGGATSFSPGAEELADYIVEVFGAQFPEAGIRAGGYNCRWNTGNKSKMSEHGSGRAFDLYVQELDEENRVPNRLVGDLIANWLMVNAPAIQVQYIIWVGRSYGPHRRAGERHRPYNGSSHYNHLHVEVNNKGARKEAPWFFNKERYAPNFTSAEIITPDSTTTAPADTTTTPGSATAVEPSAPTQTPTAPVSRQVPTAQPATPFGCEVIMRTMASYGGAGSGLGPNGSGAPVFSNAFGQGGYAAPGFVPPPGSSKAVQIIAAAEHEWRQRITQPPRGRGGRSHRKVAEFLNLSPDEFRTWERITHYYEFTDWDHFLEPHGAFLQQGQREWCGQFGAFIFKTVGIRRSIASKCLVSLIRPFNPQKWIDAYRRDFGGGGESRDSERPQWVQEELASLINSPRDLIFGKDANGEDQSWHSLGGRIIPPLDSSGNPLIQVGDFVTVGPTISLPSGARDAGQARRETKSGRHITIASAVTNEGVFTIEGNGGGWIYGMPPTKKYQDRPEQMQAWSDFNGYSPEELSEHERGYSGVIRSFHPFVCPGDGDINRTYVVKAACRPLPQDYTDFDQAGGLSVPPAP